MSDSEVAGISDRFLFQSLNQICLLQARIEKQEQDLIYLIKRISGRVLSEVSSIRPDIRSGIRYPAEYPIRYP